MILHSNCVPDPGQRIAGPEESDVLVCIGRLSPEKGFDVVLDAWRKLQPEGLRLLVAGDGPERSKLDNMVSPGVEMLGRLPRQAIETMLLEARAVLMPSLWYESQPLVALESLASGTPILGTGLGGLGETLAALGTDWTAVPGSVDDWVAQISLLTDDQVVEKGGREARLIYEERYLPTVAMKRLETIYDDVLTPTL
jgi:glycosyltransferase involved in cell wall biosynthesis